MHLLIFLHTPVINDRAINWASEQGFPPSDCTEPGRSRNESRTASVSLGFFFLLQQQAGSGLF